MDIYHTIVRPLITEKSTHLSQTKAKERGGIYTFEVNPKARKPEIKDAIEKIYGVKVLSVHTQNRRGKTRRFRLRVGESSGTKRAIVTVDPNSAIDLF